MSYLKPLYERRGNVNRNDSIIGMFESVFNDNRSFNDSDRNRLDSYISDIIENDPEIRAMHKEIEDKERKFREDNNIKEINLEIIESLFSLIPKLGSSEFQYYWDKEESIWGEDITVFNSDKLPIAQLTSRGLLMPLSTEMNEEDRIGINLLLKLTNSNVEITKDWKYSDTGEMYSIDEQPRLFELINMK